MVAQSLDALDFFEDLDAAADREAERRAASEG